MLQELLKRPIAFHPVLSRAFGGINEAILWQQLHYWKDKGKRKDGFIYKTKEKIEEETTLSSYQQDRARKKLQELGVLETKLIKANGAPTLHYKVHIGMVENLIMDYKETKESDYKETKESITESTQRVQHNSFSKEKEPSQLVDLNYDTNVDPETGEPLKDSFGRTRGGAKPTVKKDAHWLIGEFERACKKHLDFEPDSKKGWYYVAVETVKRKWITKKLMQEHIEDWFLDNSRTDEDVISFTACFSNTQMNRLKLSTVPKR